MTSRLRSSASAAASRRRRRSAGVLAAAARWRGRRHRGAAGPLGRGRLLRPRSRCARQDVDALGRLPRAASTSSMPQFFGISPREALSLDPAAAAAAGSDLGSAGARRAAARSPAAAAPPASSSASAATTTRELQLRARPLADLDAYCRHRQRAEHGRRPIVVSRWVCRGQASRSTPPARRRSSRCTSPARACAPGSASWRWPAASNLMLSPDAPMSCLSRSRMMAADGRCKTFDAAADGYVRGEGCGVVVLKRLSDAARDGDQIWAVMRGSAVNQDGRAAASPCRTAAAQEAVMRAALRDAGVGPAGDRLRRGPRHRHAARRSDRGAGAWPRCWAMAARTSSRCVVGSVKTNVGPPGGRGRHRRAHQDRAGTAASEPSRRTCTSSAQPLHSWDTMRLTFPARRTPWPRRSARAWPVSARSG